MHPEAPSSGTSPPGGLPPVKPPSGKFIAQLFLVPLLIVVGIMGLFFTMRGLFGIGEPRTREEFLSNLDQTNRDVRWRAAQELAQYLPRDDKLASDPKFALDLADRLQRTLTENEEAEKKLHELMAKSPANQTKEDQKAIAKAKKELEASRAYANYLAASLGGFTVPVGVPLLKEMALQQTGRDPKAIALRRRQAVLAVANLGKNLERFDALTTADQETALETLREEAAGAAERGKWAKAALDRTTDRLAGKPRGLGDDYLGLADADDPFLRELFALSLNFWGGDATENQQIDETLDRLSRDTGKGEELLAELAEEPDESNAATESFTKYPGLRVRYNATTALARRGSKQVNLAILKEMLDESTQREYCRRKLPDGKDVSDEGTAVQTVLETLKTVAELHHRRPDFDLSGLRPLVDQLADSDNVALRTEAKNTQIALDR
jgi:hypothetical protein